MDLKVVDGRRYLSLSWSDIEMLVDKLAERISSRYEPNMLVGILRGGAIVASMLSDVLDMREVYTIGCRSYVGVEKKETVFIYQHLSLNSLRDKDVLIVDDVADTGETMKHIVQYVKSLYPKSIKTATLHIKPHTSFLPDFYVENVNAWIVYPWGINELVRKLAPDMIPRLGISKTFEELMKIVSNADVVRRNLPSEKIKDKETVEQ
ncbi:MAG: phosphoribosyltransferase [Nitrososphaerota archaeon]